jgi:hypothetical protein
VADLLPDPEAGTLTVRLHGANAAIDRVVEKLCEELNATETVFPRMNLRLVLKLGLPAARRKVPLWRSGRSLMLPPASYRRNAFSA